MKSSIHQKFIVINIINIWTILRPENQNFDFKMSFFSLLNLKLTHFALKQTRFDEFLPLNDTFWSKTIIGTKNDFFLQFFTQKLTNFDFKMSFFKILILKLTIFEWNYFVGELVSIERLVEMQIDVHWPLATSCTNRSLCSLLVGRANSAVATTLIIAERLVPGLTLSCSVFAQCLNYSTEGHLHSMFAAPSKLDDTRGILDDSTP